MCSHKWLYKEFQQGLYVRWMLDFYEKECLLLCLCISTPFAFFSTWYNKIDENQFFPFSKQEKNVFPTIHTTRSLCNIFKLTLYSHSCVFSSHYSVLASQFPLQLQFLGLGLISYAAWSFEQKNLSTEVENQ